MKPPSQEISQDDVEQAHTYSAHPEIAAAYFLLTNGRTFRLYATGQLDAPLLSWTYGETEQRLMNLFNLVGYAAIRKRTEILKPDPNKPLGAGLPSRVRIIGGDVTYGKHQSDHPLFGQQSNVLDGLVGGITGVGVERAPDGRIHAAVSVRSPFQYVAELNKIAGIENFEFYSADEYISDDIERPTIFQNVVNGGLPAGTRAKLMPLIPEVVLPVGFNFNVYTEAVGFVNGDTFEGILSFDYHYQIVRGQPSGNPQVDLIFASVPPTANMSGQGKFKVLVGPAN